MRLNPFRGCVKLLPLFFMSLLVKTACAQDISQTYTFGIVPQQSASKTARHWVPVLNHVSKISGHKLVFRTTRSIPAFEEELKVARYDLAYMNPYHYTLYHQQSNYDAIARASNRRIRGIIVVHKDSAYKSIEDLDGQIMAFPSPNAFAASMLIRSELMSRGIEVTPRYVASHDSVYRNVNQKRFVAGGGVIRTLKNMEPSIQNNLRILYQTSDYTPHAIAAHRRIPEENIRKIQKAFISLNKTSEGQQLLRNMGIDSLEIAIDSDWDDIRKLDMDF